MRVVFLAVSVLCFVQLGFTVTHAQTVIVPTKIAEYDDPLVELPPPASGCAIGNRGPAAGFAPFVSSGFTTRVDALVVRPLHDCPQCSVGFDVSSLHFLMRVEQAHTMYLFHVAFADASDPPCPHPESEICRAENPGSDLQVEFPESGVYDVEFPIACACVASISKRAIEFVFQYAYPEVGYTAALTPCRNWGWSSATEDWFSLNVPGEMIYYAEASCCEPPVSTSEENWGSVKGRFEP